MLVPLKIGLVMHLITRYLPAPALYPKYEPDHPNRRIKVNDVV
jgi:hypothetical protein